MAILPPGVSAESFQSAIREFQDAVGRDWVFTSDDDLTRIATTSRTSRISRTS